MDTFIKKANKKKGRDMRIIFKGGQDDNFLIADYFIAYTLIDFAKYGPVNKVTDKIIHFYYHDFAIGDFNLKYIRDVK